MPQMLVCRPMCSPITARVCLLATLTIFPATVRPCAASDVRTVAASTARLFPASAARLYPREFARARPGSLPDSVVARVAGRRDVTISQFRRALPAPSGDAAQELTPAEVSGFLEVLVDRELLGEAAAAERWEWTAADSAQIEALADRLAVSAALDSALSDTRMRLAVTSGAAGPTVEEMGILTRDSTLARVGVQVDGALLARLAPAWSRLPRPTADSSLSSQLRMISALPEVAAADTDLVVARSPAGEYRVADLLAAWRHLHPAYRPRVEDAGQLEDLVRNGVFEQMLRQSAKRRGLHRRPEIVAEVARLRESLAVERLVRRDAVATGPAPPGLLEKWYREHDEPWRLPTRLHAIRLVVETREEAARTALLLRDAATAKNLAANARRAGAEFEVDLTAATDSALFAVGMRAGPGAVIGPEPLNGRWVVARIEALLPGETPPLAAVRGEVERQWRAQETERRLRELCGRLARRNTVRVNEEALQTLVDRGR